MWPPQFARDPAGPAPPQFDGLFSIESIECERDRVPHDRSERWLRAAEAGGGELRLITTTAQAQEGLVSEINTAKLAQAFRLRAANVSDYSQGKRGRDGSIWTYQNAPAGDR